MHTLFNVAYNLDNMDDDASGEDGGVERIDLADEEARERREKRQQGELGTDDIQDPEIKQAVEEAERKAEEMSTEELAEEAERGAQRVQLAEEEKEESEADVESTVSNTETEIKQAGSVMEGVSNQDVEDAIDTGLNVRDDIDPEHFDYENQDFSNFSSYGEKVTIEFNGALFLLVQPDDDTQQQLINEMQSGVFQQVEDEGGQQPDPGQMDMTLMMDALIRHTVERPENIDDLVEDWTPFERLGLGLQCMEFTGLEALGNM